MKPNRNEVAELAGALLAAKWSRGRNRLEEALTELSVCLELYEADLIKATPWYRRHAYENATPRRQFRIFLAAMSLPEPDSAEESALSGLCLIELELVWLALHLDYIKIGLEGIHADAGVGRMTSSRHVHMILMHHRTRACYVD